MTSPAVTYYSADPHGGLSADCTIAAGLVFTTQIPVDTDGTLPTDPTEQFELVLSNLTAALEAVGSSLARVAHLTIYLTDLTERDAFNVAYTRHFSPPYPVRAAIGVNQLARPGMRVEVTAIAAAQ